MINALTIINYLGEHLTINLANPFNVGLAITSITGIGPGKSDIIMNDYPLGDGAAYNMSRLSTRNIVIEIKLLAVTDNASLNTIEKVRHQLYKYVPIKKPVWLIFESDTRTVKIQGYVESNEPEIFSDQEKAQVSIICPYPFFEDVDTWTEYFEIEDHSLAYPYNGEVETGVEGEIEFTKTVPTVGEDDPSYILITNTTTEEHFKIDLKKIISKYESIGVGDKILFSTIVGEKYLHYVKNGTTYNIINCLDRSSSWFTLYRGTNNFTEASVPTWSSSNDAYMTIKFRNKTLYEGL